MSDIVERLRKCKTGWGKIKDEAADEIESLRARLAFKEVADHPNDLLDVNAICDERDALRAKVEELSKELKYEGLKTAVWQRDAEGKLEDRTAAYHELAAMTKERDNYKAIIAEQWAQPELKAALAENARLREALEKLASVEGNGVARLALATKEQS